MLKKLKTYFITIWKLAAPITHERLILLGFDYANSYYILENLAIELDPLKRRYYYIDTDGNRRRIKIMRDIAALLYGDLAYVK